jgi:hypothetical protein
LGTKLKRKDKERIKEGNRTEEKKEEEEKDNKGEK